MKKIIAASILAMTAFSFLQAQVLNVKSGAITYCFPASETGVMHYYDGSSLTIAGETYQIKDIDKIFVTEGKGENNLVRVEYAGNSAEVYVSYDIIPYISAEVNGAHVEITQSKDVSDSTCGEITYRLNGESSDGSFLLDGSFKCSIELNGVNLTNPSGAPLDIEVGKRVAIRVAEGTINSLEDGADGKQKGALYCKGHLEFKQKGTLNIKGNTGHALAAKEYIEIKNTNINITGAVKDGINCTQYFLMESGTLLISGVGEDGIQTDYKDSKNRDEEDTGSITIAGGTINISVTEDAAKALKAEGDFAMSSGSLNVNASGNGTWDSSKLKTKSASCVSADENITISGGSLNLTATGGGGKGINATGIFSVSGGDITILTSGGVCAYVNGTLYNDYTGNTDRLDSDYKSSPKGIKADGDINIENGDFNIRCTGRGGEGIESKSVLTIDGGNITVRAYDDGTNSSSHTYINGGTLDIMSIGNGDGVDSNGNIYINGGRMMIFGARQPEQGFDAGDGYSIYFTGGEILAAGGGNSVPNNSSLSTQPYLALSQGVKAGDVVKVSLDNEVLVEFTIPEDYNPQSSGFMLPPPSPFHAPGGGPGGGGPGGMGAGLIISCPGLVNGTSYSVSIGSSNLNATAKI